jgi:high-affinity iron transporter
MIVLLAAGMASQGVGFLLSAGVVPSWSDILWDTSWLLKDTSVVGKMLHTLIGTAGIQIAAYFATLAVIIALVRVARGATGAARESRQAA